MAKQEPVERCEICRYWKTYGKEGVDKIIGECRRYPPVVGRDDGQWSQIRPEVCIYDWCGEWKQNSSDTGSSEENL